MKTFLHVGCGAKRKDTTTAGFAQDGWQELRLDIDPSVVPDIVASMLDMAAVDTASMDAVYSSHNLEHLYAHEVPIALREFHRVLKPEGFAVVTCPDLQAACAEVAAGRLDTPLYQSPSGPVAALDILYGYGPLLAQGDLHMAHRVGFTADSLRNALHAAGFSTVATSRLAAPIYDLWALATVSGKDEARARQLAREHLPGIRRAERA